MTRLLKIFLAFVFVSNFLIFLKPACADTTADISLLIGDLQTITVDNLTRISITAPEIADISDAQENKVTLMGKQSGQTSLFLWDKNGKHTFNVHVSRQDPKIVKNSITRLLQDAGIFTLSVEVSSAEGKVIISGELPKDKKASLEKVLEPYADQVFNLVKEKVEQDLIQIDMQITEISASLDKNLGVAWQSEAIGGPLNLDYSEDAVPGGGAKNWFKLGTFNRQSRLATTINLLISEGKARDLSRPRILVTSGKEATINVGGEVPIQSTTTNASGGSTQTNVTFKQYGVTLSVTPTIMDGKIDVMMKLQVTDVDRTFPIQAATTGDIAYKTRSAQTQLMLEDRQTVVFAGLIRYSDGDQVKRVPLLSKVPLIGGLFRNVAKQAPDEGKELVVTLTPTIMRKREYTQDQMKLPTTEMKDFIDEVDVKQKLEREPMEGVAMARTIVVEDQPMAAASSKPIDAQADIVATAKALSRAIDKAATREGLPSIDANEDIANEPSDAATEDQAESAEDQIKANAKAVLEAAKAKTNASIHKNAETEQAVGGEGITSVTSNEENINDEAKQHVYDSEETDKPTQDQPITDLEDGDGADSEKTDTDIAKQDNADLQTDEEANGAAAEENEYVESTDKDIVAVPDTIPDVMQGEEPMAVTDTDEETIALKAPPMVSPTTLVNQEQALAEYVRSVQIKIAQAITYPPAAAKHKWEGTVKLKLIILKDGSLMDTEVSSSSRHDLFDKDALNSAINAGPFEPFNGRVSGNELTLTVPITYSHKAASVDPMVETSAVESPDSTEYMRSIQTKISRAITYPKIALRRKWEGTVVLKLRIYKDGSLAEAKIDSSSGHSVFDKDALNTAKKQAPFDPYSGGEEGQGVFIKVPITYSHNAIADPDTQATVASY